MYCPKCGAPLEETATGLLRCATGQLELSRQLSQRLRDTYGGHTIARATVPDFSGRGLFCPACATALARDYVCATCGISLKPLVHMIIELHPHGDGAGRLF